jgi:hypothetical protein
VFCPFDIETAKKHGLIAHRFYGSEDGSKVLVVDEWPDRQSFELRAALASGARPLIL